MLKPQILVANYQVGCIAFFLQEVKRRRSGKNQEISEFQLNSQRKYYLYLEVFNIFHNKFGDALAKVTQRKLDLLVYSLVFFMICIRVSFLLEKAYHYAFNTVIILNLQLRSIPGTVLVNYENQSQTTFSKKNIYSYF